MPTLETTPTLTGGPHFAANESPVVLCIDDDPDISWTIEARLHAYDVEVRRTFHGMQGIWTAVGCHPDLIIMDLAMPFGDGAYVVRCLRGNRDTAAIPIIVLTGMRDTSLESQMIQLGVDVFLRKPVGFDELKHQMSRYIDLRPKEEDALEDDAMVGE